MKKIPYHLALITGASSGIGAALARALARERLSLILIARNEKALETQAEQLRTQSPEVIVLPADLTETGAAFKVFESLKQKKLSVDLLVNNAGFGSYGYFHEQPLENESAMIDLNIKSLVQLTHLFLPDMVSSGKGAIINISSTAGFQPVPFMATYAATKAFVTSFTNALHAELQPRGVRVINICPGRTATNFQLVSGSHKIRIKSRTATTDQVVQVIVKALRHNSLNAVEGFTNKLMVQAQRLLPRKWILALAYKLFKLP